MGEYGYVIGFSHDLNYETNQVPYLHFYKIPHARIQKVLPEGSSCDIFFKLMMGEWIQIPP